jgi:hypothetical protein
MEGVVEEQEVTTRSKQRLRPTGGGILVFRASTSSHAAGGLSRSVDARVLSTSALKPKSTARGGPINRREFVAKRSARRSHRHLRGSRCKLRASGRPTEVDHGEASKTSNLPSVRADIRPPIAREVGRRNQIGFRVRGRMTGVCPIKKNHFALFVAAQDQTFTSSRFFQGTRTTPWWPDRRACRGLR